MPRDCEALGHVRKGLDPLCLVCDHVLQPKDYVGVHWPADRAYDELPADSVADINEWGGTGLNI